MADLRTVDRVRVLHPLPWLFLLAFAARLIGLSYHSLWFDEVVSTVWAAKPAGEIWRAGLSFVQDKHPPLYYLLLHAWTRLLGESDVSVRLLGVLIGALAVLPTYGIGRRLGGRRTAAIAALLLALNPFLIWYSQEARMFMPATTFLLVGLYGTLYLFHTDPGSWRLASAPYPLPPATLFALLTILGFTAALYSYLFSAFMLPVAGLWVLLLAWQGRNTPGNARRMLMGLGSLAAVGVLFLPLARNAWSVSGAESEPGRAFAGAAQALIPLLAIYALGWPRWIGNLDTALAVAAALLALAGMLVPDRLAHFQWVEYPRRTDQRRPAIDCSPMHPQRWSVFGDLVNSTVAARRPAACARSDRFRRVALLYLSGAGALPGVGPRFSGRMDVASRRWMGRAGRRSDLDAGRAARQLVARTPPRGLARDSSYHRGVCRPQ